MFSGYILRDPEFQKLKLYFQHGHTTRYEHSLSVAVLASIIAGKIHANRQMAFRAGLLHDFFLYDWHNVELEQNHAFYHPKLAAKNAERFHLTEEEIKAIRSHMFPLGPLPVSKIAWCITIADKICASEEVYKEIKYFVNRKLKYFVGFFSYPSY